MAIAGLHVPSKNQPSTAENKHSWKLKLSSVPKIQEETEIETLKLDNVYFVIEHPNKPEKFRLLRPIRM